MRDVVVCLGWCGWVVLKSRGGWQLLEGRCEWFWSFVCLSFFLSLVWIRRFYDKHRRGVGGAFIARFVDAFLSGLLFLHDRGKCNLFYLERVGVNWELFATLTVSRSHAA